MKATVLQATRKITLDDVPDPKIAAPTDAIVKVTASCVCGSDLWPYRGINEIQEPQRIGHEFVGIVQEVGSEVSTLRTGDFVIAPFTYCDNTCPHCRAGVHTACDKLGGWGSPDPNGDMVDAGQGEYVRVPMADGTLVATPEPPEESMLPSLLTLTDVMCTGWHAARSARVSAGHTAVVVGDGAVGLCGVLAASRMGAERIIAMSRHESRQKLARKFGATDIVEARGDEGVEAVREMTGGVGADAVLECVGTAQSMETAFGVLRPGGTVGYVGIPHDIELPIGQMFGRNLNIAGGIAPARAYLEELRDDVLSGAISPGAVLDQTFALSDVAQAYEAMDERRVIKAMLRP
ncbi:zinc-dependent alcohol dehydrogenase family protein [soil metagenome]